MIQTKPSHHRLLALSLLALFAMPVAAERYGFIGVEYIKDKGYINPVKAAYGYEVIAYKNNKDYEAKKERAKKNLKEENPEPELGRNFVCVNGKFRKVVAIYRVRMDIKQKGKDGKMVKGSRIFIIHAKSNSKEDLEKAKKSQIPSQYFDRKRLVLFHLEEGWTEKYYDLDKEEELKDVKKKKLEGTEKDYAEAKDEEKKGQ